MKASSSNGSIVCWRTTCGNILRTMEITNGSTSCVTYQITTHASIEQLVCVLSTLLPRLPTGALNYDLQSRKDAALAPYKVFDSVCMSKFKTVFDKLRYTPNWSTEVFKIIKVQQTNSVTYLLKDSRGKSIARGFYELHSVANSDVHLVEKVLRK